MGHHSVGVHPGCAEELVCRARQVTWEHTNGVTRRVANVLIVRRVSEQTSCFHFVFVFLFLFLVMVAVAISSLSEIFLASHHIGGMDRERLT